MKIEYDPVHDLLNIEFLPDVPIEESLLHRNDEKHDLCGGRALTREPLGTAWPVVTEAMYLLCFSWQAQDAL